MAKIKASDDVIRLELPWPPSANHYQGYRVAGKKGKPFVQTYLTAKAKQYHLDVQACVRQAGANRGLSEPLAMTIWAFPPDRRKRDLSNLPKMVEDAMEQAGVYLDDYQIARLTLIREAEIVKGGKLVVEVSVLIGCA